MNVPASGTHLDKLNSVLFYPKLMPTRTLPHGGLFLSLHSNSI